MPAAGLEPALCRHKQILSLPRLPFRHAGQYGICTEPEKHFCISDFFTLTQNRKIGKPFPTRNYTFSVGIALFHEESYFSIQNHTFR